MRETIEKLLAAGKRVIIVEPVPSPPFPVPDTFAKMLHSGLQPPDRIEVLDYETQFRPILEVFDSLGSPDSLVRIKPQNKLLNHGSLILWRDRKPLYADGSHLSSAGAFYLEDILEAAIRR